MDAVDLEDDAPDAGFLAPAPASPGAERIFAGDREEQGFVMNLSHSWAHLPDEHDALFALLGAAAAAAGLDRRERGVLVAATAGVLRDPHCSLAWGARLAEEIGDGAAAGVLTGDDGVQRLRDAGFGDTQVAALTLYAALRLAFSTVNDALGARPDRPLRDAAPPAVRAAARYGRPVASGTAAV